MSDHLPSELQSEIMKMLPLQSLFRFRSVCKSWKSVMDSSDFITGYSGQHQHLFVGYTDDKDMYNNKQISVTLPEFQYIIGSSRGLLCVYSPNRVLIFNPCFRRKAVAVDVPRVEYRWNIHITVLGFGVCRETNDPKIVKITPTTSLWQVEVFTLSTGAWRIPYSDDFSCKSVKFSCDQVVIDGCLYWLARDRLVDDEYYNLIVLFDLTSEEFREVNLPDCLAGYGFFPCIS
ncbi:putative F-box domain-containing protein [Helianthus anomalus]